MRKERINEIWGVIFLLLGLLTIASLVFFDPEDLSFYSSEPHLPPWNRTGVIGAYLAHFLILSFGLGAYLIPGFFLVWSWCFFTQRLPERKIFKLLGLAIGLVAASAFLGILFYSETRFLRAGAVGYVLGGRLLRYFGPLGSYIIAGSCLLLATLLATDFLIVPVLKDLWKNFAGLSRGFLERVQRLVEGLSELGVRFHRPKPETETPRKVKEPSKVTEPKIVEKRVEPSLPRVKPIPLQEGEYELPALDLLRKPEPAVVHSEDLRHNSRVIEETLNEFGIEARVVEVEQGPVITRYELLPAPGVKVNRILSFGDDLALGDGHGAGGRSGPCPPD